MRQASYTGKSSLRITSTAVSAAPTCAHTTLPSNPATRCTRLLGGACRLLTPVHTKVVAAVLSLTTLTSAAICSIFSLVCAPLALVGYAMRLAYALLLAAYSHPCKALFCVNVTKSLVTGAAALPGAAGLAVRRFGLSARNLLVGVALTSLQLFSTLRVSMYFLAGPLAAWLLGARAEAFFTGRLQAAVLFDFKLGYSRKGTVVTVTGSSITHTLIVQRAGVRAHLSVVSAAGTHEFCTTTACLGRLLVALAKSSAHVRIVFHLSTATPEACTPQYGAPSWVLLAPLAEFCRLVSSGRSAAWVSKEDLSPEHRAIYERAKLDPTPEEVERSRRNFGTGQNLVDAIHEAESIPGPVFRVLEAEHLAIPGMTRLRIPMPFMASPGSTTFHGLPWFLDFVHLTW